MKKIIKKIIQKAFIIFNWILLPDIMLNSTGFRKTMKMISENIFPK